MRETYISAETMALIVIAIIAGTLARFFTLREDYRQYPSYPNGYLIHLLTGFVAAALGAVAVPALTTKNYVAVTFLSLAIQQFRDIRRIEAQSLEALEKTEFTKRGEAYIDGIAKTFEARNYFSLTVALFTGTGFYIAGFWMASFFMRGMIGILLGGIAFFAIKHFSKGKNIGDIATVEAGKVRIENDQLFVDDVFVSNLVGSEMAQNLLREEGIAVVIRPRSPYYRIALDNYGQRQAIVFEAARALGIKRYSFTRKEFQEGRIVIALVPIIPDIQRMIDVVKKTPLLENVNKIQALMKTQRKRGSCP